MTYGEFQFVCAICQHDVHDIGRSARDAHVAPLCRGCEVPISSCSPYGGIRRNSSVKAGSFMDRRKVNQIGALADELRSAAQIKNWSARYARA